MNGSMNQEQTRIFGAQTVYSTLSAVNGTVVDDPENPFCFAIRWAGHDLVDQTVKGCDAVFGFTATEDSAMVNVQSGQVCPGPAASVLVLNTHRRARTTRRGSMFSSPCLNAGFLVGRDDKLITSERSAVPSTFIKIENATGFEGKVRIAREHPTPVLPRTDRIFMQPPPKSTPANTCDQPRLTDVLSKVIAAPTRERKTVSGGQLTRQRLNLNDKFWGKKSGAVPDESARPNRGGVLRRIASATSRRLHGDCTTERLFHRYSGLRRRAGSSWRARLENTVTYTCLPVSRVPGARRTINECRKDSFLASDPSPWL